MGVGRVAGACVRPHAYAQLIGLAFALWLINGIRIARDQHQMADQTVDATVASAGQKDTPPNFQ